MHYHWQDFALKDPPATVACLQGISGKSCDGETKLSPDASRSVRQSKRRFVWFIRYSNWIVWRPQSPGRLLGPQSIREIWRWIVACLRRLSDISWTAEWQAFAETPPTKAKEKRKKWQWDRIGSRIRFSLVSVVKLLDDPLADDLLMPIPKTTNSGAMLTTKKSLTNLLSAQSARWRRWIHDWLDRSGLGWPLLVAAQTETDYNRFGGRCAETAFAFYWTRSLVISSEQLIKLGSARQLLYLDKQLVTFNGIHCAPAPGYAYVYVCVQRNFSHCSAALSPNCILHIAQYIYL